MSQHDMATDRLVSIIQSIQVAQGSGVLTVRRGQGGMLEEGYIVFLNGQVKQTTVGRRTGTEARNWLSTWGQCYYRFVPSNGANPAQPGSASPGAPHSGGPHSLNGGIQSSIQTTPPTLHVNVPPEFPVERNSLSIRPQNPRTNGHIKPQVTNGHVEQSQRLLPQVSQGSARIHPIQPHEEALRRIMANRLTRTHRQLFLLINGQRSIAELAHLTGKKQEDVRTLLHDLEDIGIIHAGGL